MIERNHLAIVREVQRSGTLTEAATRLHLTQSALSHSIRKLEGQLGTEIWHREGRRLRPTQAGNALLALANRILPQLEQAEHLLRDYARGQRGLLRIGMECHPCYQWLLKIVGPFLRQWPDVDVDVKQEFQFGGIGALFNHEIDVLVTPDPLERPGLRFTPVFDYEQVLAVAPGHPLAKRAFVHPEQLSDQTLICYPVEKDRLDIYQQFLSPARCLPGRHKVIETTDIMLQMVAAGRGVAALPGWLVAEYSPRLPLVSLRLGEEGISKRIFLGMRADDAEPAYLASFINLAKGTRGP